MADSVPWLMSDDRRRHQPKETSPWRSFAAALLDAAANSASQAGAPAIEGFPLSGTSARSGGSDYQTGLEPIFESAGFHAVRRPSNNRVIMRRDLG